MKHLILILSITLIAGLANAGAGMGDSTNCPHATASLFSKTTAQSDRPTIERSKGQPTQTKSTKGSAKN